MTSSTLVLVLSSAMCLSMSAAESSFRALPSSEKIFAIATCNQGGRRGFAEGEERRCAERARCRADRVLSEREQISVSVFRLSWPTRVQAAHQRTMTRLRLSPPLLTYSSIITQFASRTCTQHLSRKPHLAPSSTRILSKCLCVRYPALCDSHLPISDLLLASSTTTTTNNLAADLKPKGEAAAKAKVSTSPPQHFPSTPSDRSFQPCCVCKDEKAARDECMLFSNAADPQADCQSMIQKYKTCMQGYGFSLP